MKAIKQLFTMALLATSLLVSNAMAHGSLEPKHGGGSKRISRHDI